MAQRGLRDPTALVSDDLWPLSRQEKRAQRLTFWVWRPPGGVWALPREGVVAEKFVLSTKVCLPWVSERGIWDVPGILPGCPRPLGVFKVRAKKVRVHFSFPTLAMYQRRSEESLHVIEVFQVLQTLLVKVSKAPFLTFRVATPSGVSRQALLEHGYERYPPGQNEAPQLLVRLSDSTICTEKLSSPISRDIAILSLRYPMSRDTF